MKPWHFKQAACSEHHVYYQKVYSSPLINHNFNIYSQTIPFCTKILFLCNCQFFSLPRQSANYTITFPFNSLFSISIKHNHASSIVRLYQTKENTQIFRLSQRHHPALSYYQSPPTRARWNVSFAVAPHIFKDFSCSASQRFFKNMTAAGSTYLILFCTTYPLFLLSVSYTSFFLFFIFLLMLGVLYN